MNGDDRSKESVSEKSAGYPHGAARLALVIMRVTLGAMFVWVFFENRGKGLYTPDGYAGLINYYATAGTAPAFWKSIMQFMANHAAVMGPVQAVTEITFGGCL